MSFKFANRHLPAGIALTCVILAGSIIAQEVVPASRTPERLRPDPFRPEREQAVTPGPLAARPDHSSSKYGHEENNDQMAALIAQALDQETDLNVEDMPIREAFELLGKQTGIRIVVEPGTVGRLPYGSSTKVSASIRNRPLRESLTALLRPLGLKFDVEDDQVVIRLTPPLRRYVGRATWQELALLEKLYTNPWSDQLARTLKFQFQNTPESSTDVNRDTLMRLARQVGQGSAAAVLEQATNQYGWTWYPSGDLIIVLPKTKQIERQLDKRVSVDYVQWSLKDVLLDLTDRAGVALSIEPGALTTVPAYIAERFSLRTLNTPIRQVLELIAGQTGLAYFIEPDGVRIAGNALTSGGSTRPAVESAESIAQETYKALRSNSIVGQITLPGPEDQPRVSFFIREGDLPPEVNEMRKVAIRDAAGSIAAALEGSTTRPAQ